MYPTFTYRPLTRTTYRVVDAQTGEEYGTIRKGYGPYWITEDPAPLRIYVTRAEAAEAVYRARHAHGFEVGAL